MTSFVPFSTAELAYIKDPQNNLTGRPAAVVASIIYGHYVPSPNALLPLRLLEDKIKQSHPNVHAAYIEGSSVNHMINFWRPISFALKNGDLFHSPDCLVQEHHSGCFYKLQPVDYSPPRLLQVGHPIPNHVVLVLTASKALGAFKASAGRSGLNRQSATAVARAAGQIHGRVANALAFTTVNLGLPSTQYGPGGSSNEVIIIRPSLVTETLDTIARVVEHSPAKHTFPNNMDRLMSTYKAADRFAQILRKGLGAFPAGKTPTFVMGNANSMALQIYELGAFLDKSRLPDWITFAWIKRCFPDNDKLGATPRNMTAAFDELEIFTVAQLKLFKSDIPRRRLIQSFEQAGFHREAAIRLYDLHLETPGSEKDLSNAFKSEVAFSGSLYANHEPLPAFLPHTPVVHEISDDDEDDM